MNRPNSSREGVLAGVMRRLLRPYGRILMARVQRELDPVREKLDAIQTELTRIHQEQRYLTLSRLPGSPNQADLTRFELSVFSQNGEDGVLAEIFRRVGTTNRYFAEIGVGVNEANGQLLADAFGWHGVFIDSDEGVCRVLQRKYARLSGIRVVRARVDGETVNMLLREAQAPQELDMLSIDIDGNEYWIWEALDEWRPRVVVVEYNAGLDPTRRLVQRYEAERQWDHSDFFGASLGALRHLASGKGYDLVHLELAGVNAFFLRHDLVGPEFTSGPRVEVRAPNYFLRNYTHTPYVGDERYQDLGESE